MLQIYRKWMSLAMKTKKISAKDMYDAITNPAINYAA